MIHLPRLAAILSVGLTCACATAPSGGRSSKGWAFRSRW